MLLVGYMTSCPLQGPLDVVWCVQVRPQFKKALLGRGELNMRSDLICH